MPPAFVEEGPAEGVDALAAGVADAKFDVLLADVAAVEDADVDEMLIKAEPDATGA